MICFEQLLCQHLSLIRSKIVHNQYTHILINFHSNGECFDFFITTSSFFPIYYSITMHNYHMYMVCVEYPLC